MLKVIIKFLARFFMVVFSVLVALAGLEMIIRWKEKILPVNETNKMAQMNNLSEEAMLINKAREAKVSAETFNIYYFGASSMWGEPYVDTIPILVEEMLRGKVNGKDLKWVNMAAPGTNFYEVSKRIKQVVDQKEIFFPSLIVIYSGHNEFLGYQDGNLGFSYRKNDKNPMGWIVSRSRLAYRVAKFFKLYKLEIDDRAFFDVAVTSNDQREKVLTDYQNQIGLVISYLKNNKVPMVISTVAGNYADFEPNRSVYTGEELKKEEFKKDMDEGADAYNNGKIKEALESYNKALKIDNKFAETYYRLGKIYQKLQQNDKAWEAYSKAVDNDMMPMRAVSSQNNFIRKLKEDDNTKIIDAVSYMRKNSSDGLIGNNLIADGHHPNLKGFMLISELYAKKIADMYPNNTKFTPLSEAEADKMFNTEEGIYTLNTSRASWLIRIATWRYDPAQRLIEAENYLNKVTSIRENDFYSTLLKMTIAYLRKDLTEANKYYEIVRKINRREVNNFLRGSWINQIVKRAMNEN